jgi:peptidoglycan hydrolase-like protein with peptidoglycan-binding domain
MRRDFFPMVVGLCVLTGLIVLNVRPPLSPSTALTAQERLPSQEQIKGAQERLKAAGHDPGSVDGVWGPQTESAVRAYQQKHGLPVSGALARIIHESQTRPWDSLLHVL